MVGHSVKFKGYRYWKANHGKDSKYYRRISKGKSVYLHREVYKEAYGDIPEGKDIHHINGDTTDNRIENLKALYRKAHKAKHVCSTPKVRANLAKIRHLTKEWHASPEGKEWHSKHGRESFKKRKPINKKCIVCGEEFNDMSRRETSVFCSNSCKSKHRRASGVDDESRVCPVCGKEFMVNKYTKIKTCSRGCANTYRAIKKQQNLKA